MFELHRLGWHDFQRLCSTILRECLGQTVQSFLDSNDGGRDGAFVGEWHTQSSESVSGQFVVQCKFSSRPSYTLRLSDVDDEERARAEIWVTRKLEDQPGEPDYDLETFRSRPGPPTEAHRSVFDDVDS